MKTKMPKVSIVMANYNCGKWIKETIDSVKNQSFQSWELIITDDCSTDNSVEIIRKECEKDTRIQLFCLENNEGAACARNNSLKYARGRYIAYLDSDDLWKKEKLENQLSYMNKNSFAMCYSDYDIVDENSIYRKTIRVPDSVTYDEYLKRPISCTHTIMFDTCVVKKDLLFMPNIRRGQDGATWLKVLKTGIEGHALHESLAMYRRHSGSLSHNKIKAIKRMWHLYRKTEKLNLPYSCYCFICYALNAIKKYS